MPATPMLAPRFASAPLRALGVSLLSIAMLSACGKAEEAAQEAAAEATTEAAIESMTGADVDVEDGGQTISGVDDQGRAFTTSHGDAARIPDNFPGDVRVPEGIVLENTMDVGSTMVVAGALAGDLATIAADLDTQMKGEGWTSRMAMIEPNSSTQLWQDGKRSVSYILEAKPEGKVAVVISYSVEADEPADADAAP